MDKKYILDGKQASWKIKRMALQILEGHLDEEVIVLAGIAPNGILIAQKLYEIIAPLVTKKVLIQEVVLDKKHPVEINLNPFIDLNHKAVVLVDDVSNSGRTLTYALKPYLQAHPASIKMLVLVDRTHKKFPVQPDYVGISLASTIQEYIDLDVEGGEIKGAWME